MKTSKNVLATLAAVVFCVRAFATGETYYIVNANRFTIGDRYYHLRVLASRTDTHVSMVQKEPRGGGNMRFSRNSSTFTHAQFEAMERRLDKWMKAARKKWGPELTKKRSHYVSVTSLGERRVELDLSETDVQEFVRIIGSAIKSGEGFKAEAWVEHNDEDI